MKYLLLLLFLGFSTIAHTQDKQQRPKRIINLEKKSKRVYNPEQRAIGQTMKLSQRLDLTNPESQKVMAVYLKYHQKRKIIKEDTTELVDQTDIDKQLAVIDAQENEALKLVLSPEQNKKWTILKIKMQVKRWLNQLKRNLFAWIAGGAISLFLIFFLIRKRRRKSPLVS